MAKDPAFLFYSQDFIVGVQTMDFEDRGKYITLLALMHQQGRMSEKTIRFLIGNISDNLKSKFLVDNNGLWYNKRLEEEAEIRRKFAESRRKNGSKGGRPKKNSIPSVLATENHMVNHMGNENEDENEDVVKRFIPPTLTQVESYCKERQNNVIPQRFIDYYEAKGWMIGKNKMKDFKAAIRTWERNEKQPSINQPIQPVDDFSNHKPQNEFS